MSEEELLKLVAADLEPDVADAQLDKILQGVIDGVLSPPIAARAVDMLVTSGCKRCYKETIQDIDRDRSYGPETWQEHLWYVVTRSAIKIPWRDEGQSRLINFIQELHTLNHSVSSVKNDGSSGESNLWDLDRRSGLPFMFNEALKVDASK